MDRAASFESHRALLFALAYRMLGSVADAEDILQEAQLKWLGVEGATVSGRAFLTTMVTRLCLDQLRSARVRRETYTGPWLPEPIVATTPADAATRTEAVSYALMVVLESLSPAERAIFLLREAFDYDYADIAAMLDLSEANCRQILKRAREHVEARKPRFNPPPERRRELIDAFLETCAHGDLTGLTQLLADDATLFSDGGGKVRAALNPIHTADHVARFLLGIRDKQPPGAGVRLAMVNGETGVTGHVAGHMYFIMQFVFNKDGRIGRLYLVVNPDKLHATNDSHGT